MTKVQLRHSIGAVLLAALAAGCSAAEDGQAGEKVALPSDEVFEFAPDGAEIAVDKAVQEEGLEAKGSASRPYGSTYVQAVTISNGQTVNYSTSGGSVGVDPVLVLFARHDNSTVFSQSPYTERPSIQTLALNDDSVGLHSSLSYTNNTGHTLNAWIMVFAYGSSTGQVQLNGGGLVNATAGSVIAAGSAGTAWTSGSNGDPWLFMFDWVPGQGNGAWNDDSNGGRESTITGATSSTMWYVAHGFNSGTTTINF